MHGGTERHTVQCQVEQTDACAEVVLILLGLLLNQRLLPETNADIWVLMLMHHLGVDVAALVPGPSTAQNHVSPDAKAALQRTMALPPMQ